MGKEKDVMQDSLPQDPDMDFDATFDDILAPDDAAQDSGEEVQQEAQESEAEKEGMAPDASAHDSEGELQSEPAGENQLSDLERKAHGYDSMLGRLEAERQKRKELEARLAEIETQAKKAAESKKEKAEVPEELKSDVEELEKRDPRLAALAQEDSPEGKRVLGFLKDYGVEYAAERGETILLRRDVDERLVQVQAQTQQSAQEAAKQAFYGAIATRHRDWVEMATNPVRIHEFKGYMDGMRKWAKSLPYKEGARAFEIMEKGTSADVIGLLDEYKESMGSRQKPAANAADAMAFPSRPGLPPTRAQASKDDFDAAFDEALGV